jgi:minichromosome maintenance protein 10
MDADTADLDAQIAKLQEERRRKLAIAERAQREREKEEAKVLIGLTPTKKKVSSDGELSVSNLVCSRAETSAKTLPMKPAQPDFTSRAPLKAPPRPKQALPSLPSAAHPTKSNLSSSLASLRKATGSSSATTPVPRSTTFASRPAGIVRAEAGPSRQLSPDLEVDEPGPQRGEDLTILENLMPGPRDFGRDPEGEHEWLHLEPNSKIRLV